MNRTIFHIDVNSAFLSWEAVFRLKFLGARTDLREIPSAVGGDSRLRHGIILAKSIPAGRYGIRTGETILEAKRKCAGLSLVPPNYSLYEKCSEAFMGLLKEYTPDVEQYSIDEAFMDMTGTQGLFGPAQEAAERIRERIREELGFTVNVGISTNKLLAKMASGLLKPDRVHTLYPEQIPEKLWPLPVSELFFAGRASAGKLLSLGIRTVGELAGSDPKLLRLHLKKQGELLWAFANGMDSSPVESVPPLQKGYGNSVTTPFDVTDRETAGRVLLSLTETVGARLRADGVKAGLIAVGIKTFDFQYASRQLLMPESTHITNELYGYALKAFDRLWNGVPIRHLGVRAGRITKEDGFRQRELFEDMQYLEKWEKMDRTVDTVRAGNGSDALMRAVFLGSPVDHMSGGISREKWSADYDGLEIE